MLGLDISLVQKKYNLREEQSDIIALEKNIQSDNVLREYFHGQEDSALALENLQDEISHLEKDLCKYKVAEDFHDIQKKADETEKQLFTLNDDIFLLEQNIKHINNSLQVRPS